MPKLEVLAATLEVKYPSAFKIFDNKGLLHQFVRDKITVNSFGVGQKHDLITFDDEKYRLHLRIAYNGCSIICRKASKIKTTFSTDVKVLLQGIFPIIDVAELTTIVIGLDYRFLLSDTERFVPLRKTEEFYQPTIQAKIGSSYVGSINDISLSPRFAYHPKDFPKALVAVVIEHEDNGLGFDMRVQWTERGIGVSSFGSGWDQRFRGLITETPVMLGRICR